MKTKITKARAALILEQPFFGSLALKLEIKEDSQCETMWVDGVKIGYNRKFVEELTMAQLKGALCHQVMHCVAHHITRRGTRDPKLWNIAADYAINPLIRKAGLKLPDGFLHDPQFDKLNAEAIYARLNQNKQEAQDPGGCGEVRDAQSQLSQAEITEIEQDWQVSVTQAAQQAKSCGKLPIELARFVEQELKAKVDWQTILRKYMQEIAKNDYRIIPPNRRFIHQGLYLPSMHSEGLGKIVIAFDTSGSIKEEQINQFFSETIGIVSDLLPEKIYVVYCDTIVCGSEEIDVTDIPDKLHPAGGGRTKFTPVFDWIEQQEINPRVLIYMTDLKCHDYPAEPVYPTVWMATQDPVLLPNRCYPPFGEIVEV